MPNALQRHIVTTYSDLRIGIAVVALLFPPSLWIFGNYFPSLQTPFQPSMSAYYHTPLRNIFVGCLFIIGSFLYIYRGFTKRENYLLNIAGISAILIALCPTMITCDKLDVVCRAHAKEVFTLPIQHGIATLIFFVCIAATCILDSKVSLAFITDSKRRGLFQKLYYSYGIAMIALPLFVAYLSYAGEADENLTDRHISYRAEFAAVWVFALYWITKTIETKNTDTDLVATVESPCNLDRKR